MRERFPYTPRMTAGTHVSPTARKSAPHSGHRRHPCSGSRDSSEYPHQMHASFSKLRETSIACQRSRTSNATIGPGAARSMNPAIVRTRMKLFEGLKPWSTSAWCHSTTTAKAPHRLARTSNAATRPTNASWPGRRRSKWEARRRLCGASSNRSAGNVAAFRMFTWSLPSPSRECDLRGFRNHTPDLRWRRRALRPRSRGAGAPAGQATTDREPVQGRPTRRGACGTSSGRTQAPRVASRVWGDAPARKRCASATSSTRPRIGSGSGTQA
jgi:hypothetical protein